MTEKRFERWNDHSCKVKDNQEDTFLNWEDVVNKLNEQQDNIDKQELRLQHLEELLELSENLNKSYREKLIDMNLKMMRIDDEC